MELFGVVLGIIIGCVVGIPIYLFQGFVLTKLWFWFVVPVGLPNINFIEAVGIVMIVDFLTSQYIPKNNDEDRISAFLYSIMGPLFILLIGWIITWFI